MRELYTLARESDTHIEMEWYPRDEVAQQEADRLTKEIDNSQWALCESETQRILEHATHTVEGWEGLTLDAFADNSNSKVPGAFYSRYWCPGTLGINGFRHRWDYNAANGKRNMVWINGDWSAMGKILAKVQEERPDCIVIYPDWPKQWRAQLAMLPSQGPHMRLRHLTHLCEAGPRVDLSKRRGPPKYDVYAAVIVWPTEQRRPPPTAHARPGAPSQ